MRLAYSTPLAATGLVLLGLAIFGQPDLYLHQVRQQWDQFLDGTSPETEPGSSHDARAPSAIASEVMLLQQQVKQMEFQLQAAQPKSEPTLQQPPPQAPPAAATPNDAPEPKIAAPSTPTPDHQNVTKFAPVAPAPPAIVALSPQKSRRLAPPADENPDGLKSVMARLRQQPAERPHLGPAHQTAVEQLPSPSPPASLSPSPSPSPSHEHLLQARLALRSGRIEDARRLLQQVQVKLVFRPIAPDASRADPPEQGASDVARALAALGANDVVRGQDYIDRALDDVSVMNR